MAGMFGGFGLSADPAESLTRTLESIEREREMRLGFIEESESSIRRNLAEIAELGKAEKLFKKALKKLEKE